MWDDPHRLNLSALLFLAAALAMFAWGGIAWAVRQPVFAIRHVAVDGTLARVNPAHVGAMIREELRGTFFTMRLADARASLQRVPWVKSVALRRRWPDRLEITLTEHAPLARWNENALIDTSGEVFAADFDGELPQLTGPEDSAPLVAARFRDFGATLAPHGLAIVDLAVSARGSWRLKTSGSTALTVDLGRNAPEERLSRFVAYYSRTMGALARAGTRVEYVDLRYRNGFAVRVPGFAEKTMKKAS